MAVVAQERRRELHIEGGRAQDVDAARFAIERLVTPAVVARVDEEWPEAFGVGARDAIHVLGFDVMRPSRTLRHGATPRRRGTQRWCCTHAQAGGFRTPLHSLGT